MKETGLEESYAYLESLNDEELCRISRLGNRDAEEILVARYHRLVRSIARPYFLAGGDTEDLLDLGALISEKYGLSPENKSKFARGLELLGLEESK